MPEFLQYGFMQRALVAGVVIGTVAPAIGIFLVLRRLSLIADTLAHVSLAGVAVALLVGVHPVLGAAAVSAMGALGIERLRTAGRLSGEVALAIFLSGGLAVAVVLIGLAGGFSVGLFAYLFGSIVAVQPADLWLIFALGLCVLTAVTLLYNVLFAVTFDEESARIQGVPVEAINLLLNFLVALTVVVAMRVVGVLLTSALIVIPAATALRVARSFRTAFVLGLIYSLIAVVAGIIGAFYLDISAGGAIVLFSIGLFTATGIAGRVRS